MLKYLFILLLLIKCLYCGIKKKFFDILKQTKTIIIMKNNLEKLYTRVFNLGTHSETIKYTNASGEIKQKDFANFNKTNIFVNSLKENGYELCDKNLRHYFK